MLEYCSAIFGSRFEPSILELPTDRLNLNSSSSALLHAIGCFKALHTVKRWCICSMALCGVLNAVPKHHVEYVCAVRNQEFTLLWYQRVKG